MSDLVVLFVVFVGGLMSGGYGTLVGGGSLLSIPILILVGLPPQIALGTNKIGIMGLAVAGGVGFHKRGNIDHKVGWIVGITSMFGAMIGAGLALNINEELLRIVIAVLTILMLGVFLVRSDAGLEKRHVNLDWPRIVKGGGLSFLLGIYAGFYGAGAGSFYSYILIFVFGQTFLKSAGTRKIASFLNNAIAFAVFAWFGKMDVAIGLVMCVGMMIGAFFSSYYAEKIGNVWIRRFFIALVVVMAVKLLF